MKTLIVSVICTAINGVIAWYSVIVFKKTLEMMWQTTRKGVELCMRYRPYATIRSIHETIDNDWFDRWMTKKTIGRMVKSGEYQKQIINGEMCLVRTKEH